MLKNIIHYAVKTCINRKLTNFTVQNTGLKTSAGPILFYFLHYMFIYGVISLVTIISIISY